MLGVGATLIISEESKAKQLIDLISVHSFYIIETCHNKRVLENKKIFSTQSKNIIKYEKCRALEFHENSFM